MRGIEKLTDRIGRLEIQNQARERIPLPAQYANQYGGDNSDQRENNPHAVGHTLMRGRGRGRRHHNLQQRVPYDDRINCNVESIKLKIVESMFNSHNFSD